MLSPSLTEQNVVHETCQGKLREFDASPAKMYSAALQAHISSQLCLLAVRSFKIFQLRKKKKQTGREILVLVPDQHGSRLQELVQWMTFLAISLYCACCTTV